MHPYRLQPQFLVLVGYIILQSRVLLFDLHDCLLVGFQLLIQLGDLI
jgi:hypothetical protein